MTKESAYEAPTYLPEDWQKEERCFEVIDGTTVPVVSDEELRGFKMILEGMQTEENDHE